MSTEPDDSDLEVRVQRRFAKLEADTGGVDPLPTRSAAAPPADADALAAAVVEQLRAEVAASVVDAVRAELPEVLRRAVEEGVAPLRDVAPPDTAAAARGRAEAADQAAARAVARVVSHVDEQLDVLRHELEGAFEEVVGRITANDRAVAALRAAHEQLRVDIQERSAPASPEAAPVDLTPVVPPLVALDEKVNAIGRMLEARAAEEAARPAEAPAPAVSDLEPAVEALHRELAAQSADLGRIAHALRSTRDDGTEVDIAHIEQVVRRGTLANAADIANLGREVEALAAALREQASALSELRKHVEWIRQRLLSH